jgi:hypothetical protein
LKVSNKIVRFEYFTGTGCDEGNSGDQWCEIGFSNQLFRLCLKYLKPETEKVSETLNNTLKEVEGKCSLQVTETSYLNDKRNSVRDI